MFKMKSILLMTIFIYCVSCHLEGPVQPRNTQTYGAPKGDVNIQRISMSRMKGTGLFWWHAKNCLINLDSFTSTIYRWDYKTGKTNATHLEIDEKLAFIIPIQNKPTQAILASDNLLRILTWNDDGTHSLSRPIKKPIPDDGYSFCKGHCNSRGNLYATASNPDNKNSTGILYKITSSGEIKHLYHFTYVASDFAFDLKTKKILYVLRKCGTKIYSYDFDIDKETLTNEKVFFESHAEPCEIKMKGIEIDRNNDVWISAEAHPGRLFKINPKNKQIKKLIIFPHDRASQITWGGPKNGSIIVGFDKTCNLCDNQSGDTMLVSGLEMPGIGNHLYKYD